MRKRHEQPPVKLILQALEENVACDTDLAHLLGLNRKTIKLYTKLLRNEKRIVPAWWERKQGGPQPVWTLRKCREIGAKKPAALTEAERMRKKRKENPSYGR